MRKAVTKVEGIVHVIPQVDDGIGWVINDLLFHGGVVSVGIGKNIYLHKGYLTPVILFHYIITFQQIQADILTERMKSGIMMMDICNWNLHGLSCEIGIFDIRKETV